MCILAVCSVCNLLEVFVTVFNSIIIAIIVASIVRKKTKEEYGLNDGF